MDKQVWVHQVGAGRGNGVQETLPDDDLPRDVSAAEGGATVSCY